MKPTLLAAVAGLVGAGLAVTAAAQTPPAGTGPAAAPTSAKPGPAKGRQCIFVRNIINYASDDADRLYIRVAVNRVYRLDLFAPCPELPWAERAIGIRSFGGSSWICDPIDAEIIVRNHGFHDRCQVRAITELSPDQIKALPKRAQP